MIPGSEPFSRWFAASLILHGTLIAGLVFGDSLFPSEGPWGDEKGGSGVIRVNVAGAPGIPSPPPPDVNRGKPPSEAPGWEPPAQTEKVEKPTPKKGPKVKDPTPTQVAANGGIPIPDRQANTKPTGEKPASQGASSDTTPINTIPTGTSGGTPDLQYGQLKTGTGGAASVGFSEGTFGRNNPSYAASVTRAVADYWQQQPGTARGSRVSVRFVINKDGSVTDIQYDQKSNNDALDRSARRAVEQAALNKRIPPLPSNYRGSSITANLTFEY
jgi:TonB family protein